MKSVKKSFILIDFLSLVTIFCMFFIIIFILQNNIKKEFLENQIKDAKTIDQFLETFILQRKNEFTLFLDNLNEKVYLNFLSNFSDLYQLNTALEIENIYLKADDSIVFPGYNFNYSSISEFLTNLSEDQISFSSLSLSADNIGLSLYVAKKLNEKIYIARIGLNKLNENLIRITNYQKSIIILATKNSYIISTTSDKISFNILPDDPIAEIDIDEKYFYTRMSSSVLDNDIVLLTRTSNAYKILDSVKNIFPFFSVILLIIFLLKTIFQIAYIFNPLDKFLVIINNWDTESSHIEEHQEILTSYEIAIIYKAFSTKANQLLNSFDVIKKSKNEILKVKQYLKNIINSMPSMLISVDNNGIIQEWNEAAVRYFNINSSEAVGKSLWDILPYFSKFKEPCESSIEEKKSFEFKRELIKNGDEKYMNISIFPLTENGTKSMAIRLDDITQLEKTEQILRQSQKMETIGTLAGGIAHDFNNVLGGIIGTLSIMKLKIQKSDDLNNISDKINDYITIIEQCSFRASEMVTHLLTISRKKESHLVLFNLNNSLKNIEKICENSFDKSINLNFTPYHHTCVVNADISQIEQALLNLCVNAAHAMTFMRGNQDSYGGVLNVMIDKIFSDKHFIKSHPEAVEMIDYWLISISDTGIGMDAKTMSKIFDPFYTTKDKDKGTGLGLSMVYNIVQSHNGFIDVYSEVGAGTTITVYLPVPTDSYLEEQISSDSVLIKGNGCILIIDDEKIIRDTYKEMLEECGYTVLLADNGYKGIEIYKENIGKIDLTILDMSMPQISGIETFKILKSFNPDIIVLMASGFRQDERAIQALKSGVNQFLQKPFTINKLSVAIAELLKKT